MAFGDNGNPVAFGQGQTAEDRALFLKQFGGEVLTAFQAQVITKGKFRERHISGGKSAQFPKTGTSQAEYVQRGQELLGNAYDTTEVEITIDGLLAAHHAIWDFDALISHFDVRGPITADMGQALARVYDQNNFRAAILSARTAAVGPFPGGLQITDAGLIATGAIDGKLWLDKIRAAKVALVKKNVPANAKFFMAVTPEVFDAIKYATNSQGFYLALSNQVNGLNGGSMAAVTDQLVFESVTILSTNLLPNTNESAVTSVWSKYRANYATTSAVMWTPDAVGVLQLKGVSIETTRDVRRQENFMVATVATGHGTLRPECAVEFKTA